MNCWIIGTVYLKPIHAVDLTVSFFKILQKYIDVFLIIIKQRKNNFGLAFDYFLFELLLFKNILAFPLNLQKNHWLLPPSPISSCLLSQFLFISSAEEWGRRQLRERKESWSLQDVNDTYHHNILQSFTQLHIFLHWSSHNKIRNAIQYFYRKIYCH